MKHSSYEKHLFLKKITVAHLDTLQMRNARGGCTTETLELTTCDKTYLFDTRAKPSDNTCYTE
jgi:hypothetical protein